MPDKRGAKARERGSFRIFPVMADVGVRITAPTENGLFETAGRALFSLMTDRRRIREQQRVPLTVAGGDPGELLVHWLNELIFQFDARSLLFRRFDRLSIRGGRLSAEGVGEPFDAARHVRGSGVKATTYHRLEVRRRGNLWTASVILDV